MLKWVFGLVIVTHLCPALARGGSLGCFLRPIKNLRWLIRRLRDGQVSQTAGQHIREFVSGLRLKHHFLLGVRGFFAAFVWLFIPTLVYASAGAIPGGGRWRPAQAVFGGTLLVLAFAWTPFLQCVAVENRFRSGLKLGTVRDTFRYAPWAWLVAIVVTLRPRPAVVPVQSLRPAPCMCSGR